MRRADPSPLRKRKRRPKPIRSREDLRKHLAGGGKLIKTLPEVFRGPTQYVDPETDRVVSTRLVNWARHEGLLRGCDDGLFGEDDAQTYVSAR